MQIETSPNGVNEALSSINSIFIEAANRSLREKCMIFQKKPLHKRWFDTSLQEPKTPGYHSKLLLFDLFNRHLRNKCFKLSKT